MPDIFLYNGEVITSDVKLRDPTVLSGSQTLTASAFVNTNSFGLDSAGFIYTASGLVNSNSFGSQLAVFVYSVSGVSNTAAFGTAVVSSGETNLVADGVLNVNTFGSPLLNAGQSNQSGGGVWLFARKPAITRKVIKLNPSGINNNQRFGKPYLKRKETIYFSSIKNNVGFGNAGAGVSYEREDEEILTFILAA